MVAATFDSRLYIMEKESKREIKQFSKEHSPEERQQLAKEIKERRRMYFDRRQALAGEIRDLTTKAQDKEMGLTEMMCGIQVLEKELAQRRRSRLVECLNFFEIKRLRKEVAGQKLSQETFERDYQQIKELMAFLTQQTQDSQELSALKQHLDDFYEEQIELYQEYQREETAKTLEQMMRDYEVVIIHGIHPSFVPGDNSLLNKSVDWQTKLKIVLALEPSLSCSTIKKGDSPSNMWSRMGLILNKGRVQRAHPQDMATVATGLKKRRTAGGLVGPEKISDQIREAILKRAADAYNELIVENPQPAGFYICLDDTGRILRQDLVAAEQIAQIAKDYGLPLYAIEQGVIKEADYDFQTKQIIPKDELSAGQITEKQFQLSVAQREQIKEELFMDPPFRLTFPEAEYCDSRFHGWQTYVEINAPQNPQAFGSQGVGYQRLKGEHGLVVNDGALVSKVGELRGIGCRVEYFFYKGRLMVRMQNKNWPEGPHTCLVLRYIDGDINQGYVQIGLGGTEKLSRPVDGNETYLSGMEQAINKWREERDNIKKEAYKGQTAFHNEWLKKLAYHLYGFSEQAGQRGDAATQERALALANQIVPQEEYQEVLKRRFDSQGRFKITEADLG